MADKDLDRVENVEIEPLSDEALEDVAGGTEIARDDGGLASSNCCSCSQCSPS